ncbi:impB/mucB/samB family C-terminal domain [Musa troglodytarum]|uniref:DNA polymerase eta n=1 Tax=Musa troglodytarum TaxID=320322 RepID=A0A9E7I9G9_9LILI|nr:impB/mucB/samB family C-terminal domain [Musa troglodytarum]
MPIARPEPQNARVIAHVDMDCFYVQVEQRKNPELRGLPTAVVQYNSWKGGGLIAVGYEARKFGVKRSMRGDEAKRICPNIQLIQVPVARGKADLNLYRNAGSEVVSILATKGRCERASIDEVYLDLTDAAEMMLSETPPEVLEEIDEEVLKSHVLGLHVFSSILKLISHPEYDLGLLFFRKMLAKLASAMHKPAQQTVVPSSSVKDLLASLPVKKMKQLGGKLGSSLQIDLGVNTVGDLLQFSQEKLQEHYGVNTGGISGDAVVDRLLPKSHGCGKTFPGPQALKTIASVENWVNQLCDELSERIQSDLDQNRRIAHTLTLHARAFKGTCSILKFLQGKIPSSTSLSGAGEFHKESFPLSSTDDVQSKGCTVMDQEVKQKALASEAASNDIDIKFQAKPLKRIGSMVVKTKDVGKSSILKFFQSSNSSFHTMNQACERSSLDQASSSSFPECEEHSDLEQIDEQVGFSEGHIDSDGHHNQTRNGYTWGINMENIDPSVLDELPMEIQREIQEWFHPPKRANTTRRVFIPIPDDAATVAAASSLVQPKTTECALWKVIFKDFVMLKSQQSANRGTFGSLHDLKVWAKSDEPELYGCADKDEIIPSCCSLLPRTRNTDKE